MAEYGEPVRVNGKLFAAPPAKTRKPRLSAYDSAMKRAEWFLAKSHSEESSHDVQFFEGLIAGLKKAKRALECDARRQTYKTEGKP